MVSLSLHCVGSHEIADAIVQIEQLAAYKSELENSLGECREAYEKLCQEKNDLCRELDASRNEYATATSQLDVCRICDILLFYSFY